MYCSSGDIVQDESAHIETLTSINRAESLISVPKCVTLESRNNILVG